MTTFSLKEDLEQDRIQLKAKIDKLAVYIDEADEKYHAYDQKLRQEDLSDSRRKFCEEERAEAISYKVEMKLQRDPLITRLKHVDQMLTDLAVMREVSMRTQGTDDFMQVEMDVVKFSEDHASNNKRLKQDFTTEWNGE